MLQAHLKIMGGKRNGDLISLTTPKFLIGREQDCHIRPNSELVSRHHCVFTLDEYSLRLRDLGSTNGTFVNNHRLESQHTLQNGDHVRVGKLEFEVLLADVPESEAVPLESAPASPGDTTELSSAETGYEIAAQPPAGDTGVISQEQIVQQPQPAQHQPQYDPDAGQPHPGYWQQPAPGYYPQPAPGYYQQYPQQPMPGYPQQPMQYPQQPMPGYPQQQPEQPSATQDSDFPDVRLPDPESTGAKDEPAPEPPPETSEESAPPQASPSELAANLLKSSRNRRGGGGGN